MLTRAAAGDTMAAKALMSTSAGFAPQAIRMPGFVEAATRPIQLLDIIPTFQTGESAMVYMEETLRTHGAAETAEGGAYAESAFAFTERNSPVRKITDSLPVTDEQLADVSMMQGYIGSRLVFGVRQRLDLQVYQGNGTGINLRGLANLSGMQTQARGADPAVDTFYKAMVKIRTVGRANPSHHLIHPLDWQGIRLQRTADGVLWGPPSEAGPDRLWGLQVVQPTRAMRAPATPAPSTFRPAVCSSARASKWPWATSMTTSARASAPCAPTPAPPWRGSSPPPSARILACNTGALDCGFCHSGRSA
jgi:HK97 family phage major capsid protein